MSASNYKIWLKSGVFMVSLLLIPFVLLAEPDKNPEENGRNYFKAHQLNTQQENVIKKMKTKLAGRQLHNIRVFDKQAIFFAFDAEQNNAFGWHRFAVEGEEESMELVASADPKLLFRTAVSPNGKELLVISETGEISVINTETQAKASLGFFTTPVAGELFATYSFPVYSPDGKYILLHNAWENELVIAEAERKNVGQAKRVAGFWLPEGGSAELPATDTDFSVYEFAPDGQKVTFGFNQTLNLSSFTKE